MLLSNSSTFNSALFDKKSSYLFSLTCLLLLFLPKINLITFGRETAGVRVDDLVLLSFATLFFSGHLALRRGLTKLEKQLALIVGFSLLSFFLNRFFVLTGTLHVDASIFYAVRIFEYFLFFYVGAMAAPFIRISTIFTAFFLWNMAIILLQKFGLVGGFSVYGYMAVIPSRYPGVASFPSEMGLLLNMAYSFFVFSKEPPSKLWNLFPTEVKRLLLTTQIYWLAIIIGALIVMTGSRIALVAIAVTFAFRLKDEIHFRTPGKLAVAAIFITAGALLFSYMITKTLSIYERSHGLFTYDNIELVQTVWQQIDTHYDPIGNEIIERETEENETLYDASWWMRIHKWGYALKIYSEHPTSWLQGVGPGFAMAGLDGGYLRILTEYGLIGSYLFFLLFSMIWHTSRLIKQVLIALLINMIFFDVYLAYKPMAFLFLLVGYHYANSSKSLSTCPSRV